MSMLRTAKELVRHSITELGLAGLHARIRKAMGQNVDHLFASSLVDRFSQIYTNRVWLNNRGSGSLSGLGSEQEFTETIRKQLPQLLESIGSKVLLDVGCGDFNWMKNIQLPCTYVGVDIVREVIDANIAKYSAETRTFRTLDATSEPLPPGPDTVLCREVLFHLCFSDIWRLIENVQRSGAAFLVATNDSDLTMNANILSGDFRSLNLRKAPFFFPSPISSISDSAISPGRILAVWRVAEIRQRPSR